ncbi:MAG: T9SS type A sorting domain-containing protein, partial [Chitinophagaceae bacterium]|nr:T9SS type A sorting domain-containing protein [Chitinophagaceae bacterium]
ARSSFSYTIPCSTPTALNAGGVTNNSANISFTGAGTAFIVEYGAVGFTPGTDANPGVGGTIVTGGSSPISLTGLSGNTAYDVYVRQDCTGDANGFSLNSSKATFTTLCVPAGDEIAYGNGSWKGYVYTWTGSPSFNTPNYKGYITENEQFDRDNGAGAIAGLTTNLCPPIPSDSFTVRYKMTKNFPAGYYQFTVGGNDGVRLSIDGGNSWLVNDWIDQSYTTYTSPLVYLNGSTNLVLEYYENAGGARSSFSYTIPCSTPTALNAGGVTNNSANISFTGAGTAFIVEYGATGFTPGTDANPGVGGTIVTGGSSPISLTGLSGNTAYDVYVRQDCTISGNGYSANSTKTTFTTLCGLISTYPFTEGFNAASLPACWSAYEGAQGASEHWQPVTADATHGAGTSAEGSHFLLMNYYDAVLSYNPYYLKSIPFDLGATAKKVKFDIWMGKNSGTDNLKFEISTNNGVSWTTLRTYSANPVNYSSNTPWDSKTIDLTAYTNQTVLFRLNATSNYGSGYCNIGFDNFIIEAIPACNEPVDLIANSITQNTASISFTGAGSAFIVEYGPVGFTPGTDSTAGVGGTLITGSASPIAISGLTGNTSYDVYVRQDCTGGGNGYSTNSSKATFTTLCGINSTYPYTEGFNTPGVIPACWSVYEGVQGSGVQWQSGALTGYSQYDIRYPAEGAGFMFFYAYYYNPNNAPYYLQSPIFNLGSSSKRARFALWMGAGVEADALKFQISTDSGSTWTSLASYSANPSHNSPNAPWDSKTVDLSAYTNQSVLFRLSVTSGTILNYRFIGFDNFIIEDKPLQAPQVVSVDSITKTTASVSFTEVGCTYIVEYGLAGFTPGTDSTAGVGGTIITTNSSPIAITGLTANTAYDVYVRRDCSATGRGFSINSNKVSFTTKCNTVTDFSENFDASLPQCWAQVGSNSVDVSNNRLRMMSYNSKAVVRMPEVSNADAGTHRLKFSTKKSGGQTGNIQVGYLTNQDDPNTFVQLGNDYIPTKSSNSSDYDNFILSPVITPPGITTLAFRESTGNNGYIILIDNVKYETIPNCLEATDIVANTITNNTAIIHFTGTGSAFVVEYGATGFTPGTNNNAAVGGTIVTGGNSPIAITGLTANTTYDVYVRQNCTNSGNGYSANSIKATFTTLCDAANVPYILDIPFVDQYTLPNCTYNQTLFQGTGPDRDSRWLIETPPSGNALYYQYYEDSVNTWFYTNGINLTAGSNYIINYMYAKQSGAIQKLKIAYGILPNNTAMITQLADHSITANFGYSSNSVSFTPQVTGVYYFGFNLYTGSNTGGTSNKVRIKNISIDEVGQNKWTGTTDTDWNKGSNWSLGTMPTPSSNVVIPNTINKPVIGVNFPLIREAKNITIQTGSNLTITNESSLLVYGNIANNGTIIADSGTIAFVGTTLQTFNTGNTDIAIKGLGMDNAVGLTLSGTGKLNVTSELYTYRQGVFTTNNLLVLKSNENRTAILQSMFSLPTFVGNVTVERYIPAKASRKWSFLASPINQTLQDSWQQQIHITGAGTGGTVCPALTSHSNGFDATSTNAPSAYTYDASQTTGSRWQAVTNTNATNIGQGKAFRVNVRGSRSLGCDLLNGVNMVPNAVTLSSSGTLSTANKNFGTFSITYPNNGINNWVLIGNPYPANVSFSDLLSDLGNSNAIDSVYAVYIPSNNAGVYSYWSNVDGVFTGGTGYNNDNGNLIASGQAVFVKSKNVGNITLNFNEDLKYYTFSEEDLGYFRNNRRTINEKVKVSYGTIDKKIDEIVVRYDNNVTISNTALGKLDIPSMNYGTYITSLKGTTHTAVQTRSLSTLSTDEVWLNIGATQSGNYTFNFSDYENFTGADIYLVDHLAKITQDVKANPDYVFSVDVNNAATKGSNRFSIVFTKRIVEPSIVNNNIKMYPNPANKQVTLLLPQIADINYNIKVTDMAGKIILQQSRAGGYKQLNIEKLSTGTYIVEIIDSKGNRTTEKLIKN